jgi:hypothetical protein
MTAIDDAIEHILGKIGWCQKQAEDLKDRELLFLYGGWTAGLVEALLFLKELKMQQVKGV